MESEEKKQRLAAHRPKIVSAAGYGEMNATTRATCWFLLYEVVIIAQICNYFPTFSITVIYLFESMNLSHHNGPAGEQRHHGN